MPFPLQSPDIINVTKPVIGRVGQLDTVELASPADSVGVDFAVKVGRPVLKPSSDTVQSV